MPHARLCAAGCQPVAPGTVATWSAGGRVRSCAKALLEQEHASNLVETALVLPMYFLLVFTLMSFAFFFFAYANASYASRLGARFAATHSSASLLPCTTTSIQNLVGPYLWGASAGASPVSVQWSPSNTIGSTVTVSVKVTYTSGMPLTSFTGLVVNVAAQQVIVH